MDAETEREIGHLKDHLEAMIKSNAEIEYLRYKNQQTAVELARVTNDKRLDSMNEWRETISDLSSRLVPRVEYEAELRATNAKIDVIKEPKWLQLGGFLSVIAALIGGCWLVIGLRIDESVVPVATTLELVKSTQQAVLSRVGIIEQSTSRFNELSANSSADRRQLNDRIGITERLLADNIGGDKAKTAALDTKLAEIESQLCAADAVRNLMHGEQQRFIALLWSKTYPESTMPVSNNFYPRICNRRVSE